MFGSLHHYSNLSEIGIPGKSWKFRANYELRNSPGDQFTLRITGGQSETIRTPRPLACMKREEPVSL